MGKGEVSAMRFIYRESINWNSSPNRLRKLINVAFIHVFYTSTAYILKLIFLPPAGFNCILLPVTPTAMISIPIINSAIPKNTDTNTAPAKGDAITKKDIAIAKAPAPMLNPLAQPGLWLLPNPYTTWEIPANNKPMPNIIITNTPVDTGYPTAIEPL